MLSCYYFMTLAVPSMRRNTIAMRRSRGFFGVWRSSITGTTHILTVMVILRLNVLDGIIGRCMPKGIGFFIFSVSGDSKIAPTPARGDCYFGLGCPGP